MIAVSNKFTMFVVPNSAKSDSSAHHIFDSAYKAGFLRRVYSIRLALFGDIRGRLASFVIHLTNFFLKMPNSGKVSGTVNNSTRTARAHSAQFSQRIYNVLSGGSCKVFFAEIENVCIFVVRHDTNGINKVHTTRLIRRCPLSTFGLPKVSCRNEIGGNAFFLRKPQILSTLNF